MEQKSSFWPVVTAIIITAVIVGGGMYYFNKTTKTEEPVVITTPVETTTPTVSTKTFVDYYTTRDQFLDSSMRKTPTELDLKEIAKIEIACPENADGPCGGFLEIVSSSTLGSGNQEFYLAQEGGAGYSYYGPFTDDLNRIVNEAKQSEPLKEVY